MKLPNFLKPDYKPSEESIAYAKAFERYHEKFGTENLNTEDRYYSTEQWTKIFNECVDRGIEVDELLSINEDNLIEITQTSHTQKV